MEISNKVLDFKGGAIKAVIFDLDGTLIDSEDNYYEADKILLSRYGIDFTQEDKKQYIGTGNLEMMKRIKLRYNINETAETLLEKKNSLYLNLAKNNTKVFSEMKEFLNLLKDNNYPLAVASGSSPIILEELLTSLDLKKYFDIIVSAEEVKKGKPAPDIFLETANRLNIEPHNCCVIEDSQYGVEAAKKAFMYCIAIPYLTEKPLADSFTLADLIFEDGMKQFLAKKAFDWVKEF
ncbi:MAG: hydrolase [Spirochaetes bacterium GWD1_27_9]|nr:MAG: hydrolase [Spirochaetes bacterium GWB1_27_13]OHD27563.1 MAG: hydrolase [Spirochaetes bacterium GWC1_27_15]OHD44743.1 MAG: hydrolase [Spirochaetes bacterium GWD1_27_9]